MILLDANCFLRWLTQPVTDDDLRRSELTGELFRQMRQGELRATTTESVIAEIAYVLTAKAHYNLPASEAVRSMRLMLDLPGLVISGAQRRLWLTALELWGLDQGLDFVDCLLAVSARQRGYELATFDRRLSRTPDVPLHWPPGS